MVDFPDYKDIPYAIRKNPSRRWNLMVGLLKGDVTYDPQTKTFTGLELLGTARQTVIPEPTEDPEVRNVHIDVNNGTDGVEGATVVIGETSKTTGSAGGCNFTGIADGKYNVTVTAEGYAEKTQEITVSEEDTSFVISLTAE